MDVQKNNITPNSHHLSMHAQETVAAEKSAILSLGSDHHHHKESPYLDVPGS